MMMVVCQQEDQKGKRGEREKCSALIGLLLCEEGEIKEKKEGRSRAAHHEDLTVPNMKGKKNPVPSPASRFERAGRGGGRGAMAEWRLLAVLSLGLRAVGRGRGGKGQGEKKKKKGGSHTGLCTSCCRP